MGVKARDVHKLFKQALVSRRYLTEDLARVLWKKCEEAARTLNEEIPAQYSANEVHVYIGEINETLKPLSLEFKARNDEVTGKKIWAMVNTVDGEIAQIATEYSPAEIAYFKQIMELIMTAPSNAYCVSSLAAVREVNNMGNKMTKSAAENTLTNLVAKGWLYKTPRGRYTLSARSLLELELYIRRTFQDEVIDCALCEQLLTLGYTCASNHPNHPVQKPCGTYIHKHCFASHRQDSAKCLVCDIDWSKQGGVKHIGEEGATDGFDDNLKRRRRQPEANDALETESEEEINDEPSQASRPKGKERLVRKPQPTQQAQGLDDEEDEQPSQSMDLDGEGDATPRLSAKAKGKQRAR